MADVTVKSFDAADGESWELEPGTIVRVGPEAKRKLVAGDSGVTLVSIGAAPGKGSPRA
jgi:hypothetical protein